MKSILLVDIDSRPNFGNLALLKIEKYHLEKGNNVVWNMSPLYASEFDSVFVSCIFSFNREKCIPWKGKAVIGGTGWNFNLSLPPEIEDIKLRRNIDFTTRGCIRLCPFCVVPKKEGNIRAVADIYNIWDRKSKKITLLDNNILALPAHFEMIADQLRRESLTVDFNQGLDFRLLTPSIIKQLQSLKWKQLRFSWDSGEDETQGMKNLKDWFGQCIIYVLAGHLSFERTLEKLNTLRDIGHNAYLMRLESCRGDRKYNLLARWTNQMWVFKKYTFSQFIEVDRFKHQVAPDTEQKKLFDYAI